MSQHSNYKNCLQGESTHFGLRVSMPKLSPYSIYTYCLQEELTHFSVRLF